MNLHPDALRYGRLRSPTANQNQNCPLVWHDQHARTSARSGMIEQLETRVLLTGTPIISDAFTDGPAWTGTNIAGLAPTVTNLPAGTYQTAAGFTYDQQVLGTFNGIFSNSVYFHGFGAVGISLASNASYTKPTALGVSGQIAFELSPGNVSDAFLGFYSAVSSSYNSSDLTNFSGLELNSNGSLTLINNGVAGKTIAFTGTYTPGSYATLSYSINTTTGGISSVSLTGSTSDYTQFSSTAFTTAATTFGGIGGDNDPVSRVHFGSYQVSALATTAPVAAKLAYGQVPSNASTGALITPAITVDVEDASGNIVSSDSSLVTLSIASGPGTVSGTTSVAAVNGVATFPNLSFATAGTYTLAASDSTLTSVTSSSFTISAPVVATKLAFAQSPSNASAGVTIVPSVVVDVEDSKGNILSTDSSVVTLSIATGTGSLAGTTSVTAVNGVATFSTLSLPTPGTYTLLASDSTLTSATSVSFTISAPVVATKLAFGQSPSNASAGVTIVPSVVVDVEDSKGNILSTDSSVVTLSIATGTGSLTGTTSVAAVNGVATFSTLSLPTPGTYTLLASDSTLTSATSASFTIAAPVVATKLAFGQGPSGAVAGAAITPSITVDVEDSKGNILSTDSSTVTLSIASGTGSLGGTISAAAVGGVATFSSVSLSAAGSFTLGASDALLTPAISNSFTISAPVVAPTPGVPIISDAFTSGPAWTGENIAGLRPTVADLPGGVYQTAAGFTYDQQVLGTFNGVYSNSVYFHNTGVIAISLASQGTYSKPAGLAVSAQIAFEQTSSFVPNAYLGFYSAVSSGTNLNDLLNFTGLQLNANGGLTLISNGVAGKTIAFTGTYAPASFVTLSYDVNTTTGTIYGVSLAGSTSNYTQFSSTAFTAAATAFGGIGGDNNPSDRVHFDSYQVAVLATTAPVPAKLAFGQVPSNASTGSLIAPAITVDVEDASGNIVSSDSSLVTLSIASGPGTVSGTTSVAAVNGVATFPNLSFATAGTYTLAATDSTLTSVTSSSFTISAPVVATKLAFAQSPSNVSAGVTIVPSVVVDVEDSKGNILSTDSSVVTLSIATGTGSLTGTTSVAAVNGVATFSTLSLPTPGTYTLLASDSTLTSATSASFTISAPVVATKLAFGQSPSNASAGVTIVPSVVVDVEDSKGNMLSTDSSVVTLSIATGTGSLTGTTSVAAVNGVATFSTLSLPTPGTYTLLASDSTLTSVTSTSFTITAPLAAGGLSNTDPFGVASSDQSSGTYSAWAGKIAQAGVKWVRLFPQWNQIEPSPNTFDFSSIDSVTATAAANNQDVSGILYYDANWVSSAGLLPSFNLPAWSAYVAAVVAHTTGKVEYWEIWNEPNSSSAAGTPQDYANVVVSAYNTIKAIDPNAQVGLDVASVDVNYLEQVIQDGAANHFDYIAVHPYEVLEQIDQGWDGEYMGIVPTIRKMLAVNNSAKQNVPIWFTEMGEEVGTANGPLTITYANQAQDLVKAFTMGVAQGVTRMDWYEAEDSGIGDSGFGLLDSNGNPTLSYTAMQSLTTYLGTTPQYQGWLQLNGTDDAFVFQGATTSVMAAWAQPNSTDSVTFNSAVQVVNPTTGSISILSARSVLTLTSAPVLIVGVPTNLLAQAQADRSQPFSWGGNFTNAASVSIQMGSPNTESGLHQMNADQSSKAVTVYGSSARLSNDSNSDVNQVFEVDPNFISYGNSTVNITVVTRRDANNDPAGFNISYESTTGIKHNTTTGWYYVPGNDRWYSQTFTLTDAEFDSKWGYNFSISSDSPANGAFYIQSVTVTKGPAVIPTAPTSLTAVPGNAQAALNWNAVSGATSYNLYRATFSGGEVLYQTGLTATNYIDTLLTNGQTYYYEVTAVNSAGESVKGVEISVVPTT